MAHVNLGENRSRGYGTHSVHKVGHHHCRLLEPAAWNLAVVANHGHPKESDLSRASETSSRWGLATHGGLSSNDNSERNRNLPT